MKKEKRSQVKSLSVHLKKLGEGARKGAIKLKPKQAEVKQLQRLQEKKMKQNTRTMGKSTN